MNRLIQLGILVFIPFLPLWSALIFKGTGKNFMEYINVILLPLLIYILITKKTTLPSYLFFLLLFTIYQLTSVYLTDTLPEYSNWILYILGNVNIGAFCLLFIIENTSFKPKFIRNLNQSVFIVIVISLLVSMVQIKDPYFFVSPEISEQEHNRMFFEEGRCLSIYSWIDINSNGISFPILVAIAISVFGTRDLRFPVILLAGALVSFLSKARYVMLSVIIAISQLIFDTQVKLKSKVYFAFTAVAGFFFLILLADMAGYDIQGVIDDRILEKNSEMASANTRILSYEVFMRVFPDNPLWGVGPKTRSNVRRMLGEETPIIHIGYLSYLYYYGLAGSGLLFIAIFLLLKRAWFIGKMFGFWGSFYGLLTFCLANATFVYFNLMEVGIVLAVVYIRYFYEFATEELSGEQAKGILLLLKNANLKGNLEENPIARYNTSGIRV